MKTFTSSVIILGSLVGAQDYDLDLLGDVNLSELSDILALYDVDYGRDYSAYNPAEASAEDAGYETAATADELEQVDYTITETANLDELGDIGDGQERRPLSLIDFSDMAGESLRINTANPTYNFCRRCEGSTQNDCFLANQEDECNDAQSVCQVTYRYDVTGTPRFWSSCTQQNACEAKERQNFVGASHFHRACRPSLMAPRFLTGAECTFCTGMNLSGSPLLFAANTDAGFLVGYGVSLGLTAVISDPETYMDPALTSTYILGSHTYPGPS